jgi:hypothetical protein
VSHEPSKPKKKEKVERFLSKCREIMAAGSRGSLFPVVR